MYSWGHLSCRLFPGYPITLSSRTSLLSVPWKDPILVGFIIFLLLNCPPCSHVCLGISFVSAHPEYPYRKPVLTPVPRMRAHPPWTPVHITSLFQFLQNTIFSNVPFVQILVDGKDYVPSSSLSYYRIFPLCQSPQIINSWKPEQHSLPLCNPYITPQNAWYTVDTQVLRRKFSDTVPPPPVVLPQGGSHTAAWIYCFSQERQL